MKERRPIFYDEERVRWRRTRRVLEISAVALTLLLAYFFVTIAVSVELPAGLLPSTNPGLHALKLKKKPAPVREGRQRRVSHLGTVPATYDPLRAAFFVSWDPNSLASLRKHYKELDLLLPEQLHAVTPDGAITIVDYEHGQRTAKCTPAEAVAILKDDKLHQWMKSTFVDQPAIPMIGLLNNYDGVSWHIKEMAEMLGSAAARHKLSQDLVQFAQQAHEAGVLVDFEEVPDASQKNYREFAAELASGMHAASLKLMIALPARDDAYDYEFFGKQADAIVLMNYDEHWLTSPPGPIASQDWFVENLRQVLEEVPAQKIVVTVGNYAYDWTVTDKNKPVTSETLTIQEALLHAYESEAPVEFDAASLNPHYSYSDEQNHIHQVWMLDAVTAYNQLRASERLGVQGTAMWRLGSADTSVWPIWDATRPDDAARNKLTDLPPGPDLILEGSGDIWHFVDTPKDGKRSFTYDPNTDLFTSEKYDAYPRSYNIDEIGNHTYTHPAWDEISKTQARWELNLTQRLIESTLGVKTILFRPPYGIDHQPEYAEEVSQLPFAQDMGYLIIGQKIDPHDWQLVNGKPNPAQEIVDQVLQQANDGNIILFHDGGGDRTQTIAALPQVIDTLRARGYSFVSVPDLLGKTRAQVMLPLSSQEQLEARADGFIFGIYHWFRVGIATVFMAGIVLVSGRALVIGILALIEKCRPDHHILSDPPPTVSVLIPAHDEESVIVQTVNSVLASDFAELHVIVIDDGSTDKTGDLLDEHFGREPRVHIIHQVNRGKPAALSAGIASADSEIVVTIDADTEIEPDAISKLVRHFSDPRVGAVAGNVKVGNRSRWLTRWQALEYITSQNMEKRAFDLLNCITVVPGALGAWRRKAIEDAGGITADTVAEDADLTIAIRRLGWRITYDEAAIAWTEAPETPGVLIRQRFRWTFGTLQSFWKHKDTLFRPKYGTLGWVALPNIFLFQVLLPLISPIIDLLFLGAVVLWALEKWHFPYIPQIHSSTGDLLRSVLFFIGFLLIDVLTCVIAFALERDEDWTLLVPVLLQRFYYRQLMYVVLFRSVKEAVSGRPVGWHGVGTETPVPQRQRTAPAES